MLHAIQASIKITRYGMNSCHECILPEPQIGKLGRGIQYKLVSVVSTAFDTTGKIHWFSGQFWYPRGRQDPEQRTKTCTKQRELILGVIQRNETVNLSPILYVLGITTLRPVEAYARQWNRSSFV